MEKAQLIQTVKAARDGDGGARQTLYVDFAKPVYYLALKLMGSHEDAEDMMQEVFITAFERISELREAEAFPRWLNRITANKCINALNKREDVIDADIGELEGVLEFSEEDDPLLIPEKSLDNAETARMITAIIDELPLPQRICAYCYYYQNLTVAQIAEALDTNENTVKSRLALARAKIREELERLNKEEDIKLYGALPLLLAPMLRESLKQFEMPQGLAERAWSEIASAGATSAASSAGGITKGVLSMGIKAKVALVIAGLTVAGGVTAAVMLNSPGSQPTPAPAGRSTPTPTPTPRAESTADIGVAAAKANSEGDFEWAYVDDREASVRITGYTGKSNDVVVPDKIKGKPVTHIAWGAFEGRSELTSITLPDSVTFIGVEAFADCTGLTSFTIPKDVTEISVQAFRGCTGLQSVTLNDGLTTIKSGAFLNCTALISITFPDSVTALGDTDPRSTGAFGGCTGLTSVTIPDSVTILGACTFEDCENLESVTIGSGVTTIGYAAFRSCKGLQSITIPDNVTSISISIATKTAEVFKDCSDTLSVTYKGETYGMVWQQHKFYGDAYDIYDISQEFYDNFELVKG